MDKVLNQDEIDAMFRAMRGENKAVIEPAIKAWDFRGVGLGKDQVQSISALHEGFARNLTHWLGAYLRVGFDCNLVSVEQLQYREVMARVPEMAYLASLIIEPNNALAVLQLELALAFPIIDVLLGGPGAAGPHRELTGIEEQILEDVVRIIIRELGTAWGSMGLQFNFEFDQRQQPTQMQRLMPPSEPTLALSFEIRIAESQGTLNVVLPGVVSDTLIRKLAKEWEYKRPRAAADGDKRLRAQMLDATFLAELQVEVTVPAKKLLNLEAGDLLVFPYAADAPATLRIGGQKMYAARVARHGPQRAAQLQARIERETRTRRQA
jgi:flagellar motor switch protein FliM